MCLWYSTYALDLISAEVGDLVHDHERYTPTKVDKLVHCEGHDAGGEDVVLHVGVPRCPRLFEHIEVDIIL